MSIHTPPSHSRVLVQDHVPRRVALIRDVHAVLGALSLWSLPHGALQWRLLYAEDPEQPYTPDPPLNQEFSKSAAHLAKLGSQRCQQWIGYLEHKDYTSNDALHNYTMLEYLGLFGRPRTTTERARNEFVQVSLP